MPLYTYLNLTTGKQEVHMRTIAQRDTLGGYERIFEAPRNLAAKICPSDQLTVQARQVLDGYKKLENSGQLKKTRAEAGQIRDAWSGLTTKSAAAEEHEYVTKQADKEN